MQYVPFQLPLKTARPYSQTASCHDHGKYAS